MITNLFIYGLPKLAVDSLFTSLQEAAHYVRTGYGDSAIFYQGKHWVAPILAIVQGNGVGSVRWQL
jgi:hypothetical protein